MNYVVTVALTILIVVAAVAMFELYRLLRKARETVDDLGKQTIEMVNSANDTIDQLQPVIAKADGMVEDLQPAIKQVGPLLEKTNTAIDVATVDLASVNDILVDVTSVTDTASNVTSTVSKAANSAVSGVAGVVGKFTGAKSNKQKKLASKNHGLDRAHDEQLVEEAELEAAPSTEAVQRDYFTYSSDAREAQE